MYVILGVLRTNYLLHLKATAVHHAPRWNKAGMAFSHLQETSVELGVRLHGGDVQEELGLGGKCWPEN